MVALTFGWWVSAHSERYDQKQWGLLRIAAPAILAISTSGLLALGLTFVTAWALATSSLNREKFPTLAPLLEKSNDLIRSWGTRFSQRQQSVLPKIKGFLPEGKLTDAAVWSTKKLVHKTVELWGTFKGFAFQSALDLLAIQSGTSQKTYNQLTAAERGYRSVLLAMRGGSKPGSYRHGVAEALSLPALILFYTIATVNRRVGLLILSTVASYTGSQLVGGFVFVASLSGGVGGVVMALAFFSAAWHFYQKFRGDGWKNEGIECPCGFVRAPGTCGITGWRTGYLRIGSRCNCWKIPCLEPVGHNPFPQY